MRFLDYSFYFLLWLFGFYFNEVIILNEKFLLLGIFISFILISKNSVGKSLKGYFLGLKKELINEIFLIEYWNDIKFSDNFFYLTIDLFRQRIFKKIFNIYLKGLNFLIIFYYNFYIKKNNLTFINFFEILVTDIYYFILKKHLYIKLNFLYRSYYYIFYKFRIIN